MALYELAYICHYIELVLLWRNLNHNIAGGKKSLPHIEAVLDKKYFNWAEPIPGPTTERFAEKAKKYETCIILGIFEKAPAEGVYYNSTVVLGPNGNIVDGIFPDGRKTLRYTKAHIPYHVAKRSEHYDETFYFTPGDGWPIFNTPKEEQLTLVGAKF